MSESTSVPGAARRGRSPADESVLAAVMRATSMTPSAAEWPHAVCRGLVHLAGVRMAAIYRASGRTVDRVAVHGLDGAPLPQQVRRVTQIRAPRLLRYPARHRGRTVGWLLVEPALPTPLPPPIRGVCAELARRLPSLLHMTAEIGRFRERIRALETAKSMHDDSINRSPAIVATWGPAPDYPVRFISRNISQFGYRPADFLSGRIAYRDLIHPDDRGRIREHIARLRRTGRREFVARYRLRNARGEWRWIEAHVVQAMQGRRRIELYHGVLIDVTAQRAAETSSRLAVQSFHEIAETIRDLFFVMEYPSLRPLYLSPGTRASTGYTAARLARDPDLWRKTAHPDDLAAVVRALHRCAKRGSATLEFRLVHRDGTARWTEMRVAAVRDDRGRVIRITGLHQDIGDRKRAEAESRRREQTEALISRVSAVLLPSRAIHLARRMRGALGLGGTHLGVDRCVLRLPTRDPAALVVRAAWVRPGHRPGARIARDIPGDLYPAGWKRLASGRPVELALGGATRLPQRAVEELRAVGVRSIIFIPLLARGRLQAVVTFATRSGSTRWPPTALRIGRALGRLLLKSVQHAEAHTEDRKSVV